MSFTGASYCKILRSLKPAVHEATLSLLRYCTQQISSYLLVTCLLWIGNIVVWKHHHEPQRALWQCMAGLSLKNSPERWSQQCRYQCASSSAPTKLYNHKITLNYQLNNLVIMKLHEWNSRKCTKFDIYVLGCKDCVSAHSIYYDRCAYVLSISLVMRQESGDVKHYLPVFEFGENGVLTCLIIYNV